MDVSLAVSIASAVAALTAVAISIWQARAMTRQALQPVVLGTFQEARDPEWFAARDYIFEHLTADHSPERGISGLPEPARAAIRKVGFLFDNAGLLIVHGAVPEKLVLSFFGESIPVFWRILEPFIRKEAELRQMGIMVFFEHLVTRAQAHPAADIRRELGLRRVEADHPVSE
ncbi:DUF4760 domain-containing protein [Nonomuraea guangzhouensis]|uniref:DUF4760 domain-containing protein n=1 Tax=Nonomuraea guangzhouensis TaxID=1291555 RepID=A0ABW4G533_9ACTN|nr:hypothetical protein [Nonomuraea guangzhouensis]